MHKYQYIIRLISRSNPNYLSVKYFLVLEYFIYFNRWKLYIQHVFWLGFMKHSFPPLLASDFELFFRGESFCCFSYADFLAVFEADILAVFLGQCDGDCLDLSVSLKTIFTQLTTLQFDLKSICLFTGVIFGSVLQIFFIVWCLMFFTCPDILYPPNGTWSSKFEFCWWFKIIKHWIST